MPATLDHMGAKKTTDRHKPSRMVRVPERVAAAMESAGARVESKLAEMVKIACIEYLEKRGLWPPPKPKP